MLGCSYGDVHAGMYLYRDIHAAIYTSSYRGVDVGNVLTCRCAWWDVLRDVHVRMCLDT